MYSKSNQWVQLSQHVTKYMYPLIQLILNFCDVIDHFSSDSHFSRDNFDTTCYSGQELYEIVNKKMVFTT